MAATRLEQTIDCLILTVQVIVQVIGDAPTVSCTGHSVDQQADPAFTADQTVALLSKSEKLLIFTAPSGKRATTSN